MAVLVKSRLPTDRLWTTAEVAKYLGMSVRWVRDSDVPRIRLRGSGKRKSARYDPGAVRDWARRQNGREKE